MNITAFVLCNDANGVPTLFSQKVALDEVLYIDGMHYEIAKNAAAAEGYEVTRAGVFDENDYAAAQIRNGELKDWLSGDKSQAGEIKVFVLCDDANGVPTFAAHVSSDLKEEQIEAGHHYALAIEAAKDLGYEGAMIAFDENDDAARQIMSGTIASLLCEA